VTGLRQLRASWARSRKRKADAEAAARRHRDEISRERANAYCYGRDAGAQDVWDRLRRPRLPDGLLNGAPIQERVPTVEIMAIPARTRFMEAPTVYRLRFRRVTQGYMDPCGVRVEWTTWEPEDRPQAFPVSS
jgi:hypothetical protein